MSFVSQDKNRIGADENQPSLLSRRVLFGFGFILLLLVSGLALALHAYVVQKAEHDITTMLLQHKGVHQYVQQQSHVEMRELKKSGQMPADLYSPVLFSSSYMVRNMHSLYNAERRKAGLPELYYKMAADNPRNPVNKADARELAIIEQFNQDPSLTHVERIIEENGKKFLYVASPFLANNENCLTCHGSRENAPIQLQQRYPGEGGFNEQIGRVRAIESLKAPLKGEWTIPVIAMAATSVLGLLLAGLGFGNRRLKSAVHSRTDALAARTRQLQESEDHLESTLNSIGDAVIAVNEDSIITRMNPEAVRLTGFTAQEAVGKLLYDVFQVGELSEKQSESVSYRRPVEAQTVRIGDVVDVLTLTSRSGEQFIISCHSSPLVGTRADTQGAVLVFRDITAQREMEARLRQSEKMDAIGNLAGGIAHDFNNMLAGIMGATELLQDMVPSPSKAKELLQMIDHSAVRAAELTQSLLTFSKCSTPEFVHVNVHKTIEDTIRILERTLDKRIEIKTSLLASRCTINGNATLIENALLNLGINGGKAMPEGGQLTFSTSNLPEGATGESIDILKIQVIDSGCGIAKEHLPHIFEPFFTTRVTGEGTGLGLASVYGAITSHHGDISVKSTPNTGTCFTITLPLVFEEESLGPSAEKRLSGKGTILVADDEPVVRNTICKMLTTMGYQVIMAVNGADALTQYKAHAASIDIVLLDMMMPEMNGADCFREIRKIAPSAKIIVSSGYSEGSEIQNLRTEGLAGFIAKPFRRADLAEVIGQL